MSFAAKSGYSPSWKICFLGDPQVNEILRRAELWILLGYTFYCTDFNKFINRVPFTFFAVFFFKKLLFKRLIWTAIEVRLDCPSLSNLILTLEISMLCLKRKNRNCSFFMIIRTTFHNIFIHLYAFIMSCTRFRVIVAWTSGNSSLETGAISEV